MSEIIAVVVAVPIIAFVLPFLIVPPVMLAVSIMDGISDRWEQFRYRRSLKRKGIVVD